MSIIFSIGGIKMKYKYSVQPINYLFKRTVSFDDKISSSNFICLTKDIGNYPIKQVTKKELYEIVKPGTDTHKIDIYVNDDGTIDGDTPAKEFVEWFNGHTK